MDSDQPYEWGDLSFDAFDAEEFIADLLRQLAEPATPLPPGPWFL